MSGKKRKKEKIPEIPAPQASTGRFDIGILLLLVALSFALYWNVLRAPFIWDDRYLITDNHFIKNLKYIPAAFQHHLYYSTAGLSNFYRPLQTILLVVDHSIWKENPLGYHITSIAFHAASAYLVYLFLTALFNRRLISAMVGVLFACHPINSTVVDYISSRADSQVTFFILLSLWLFILAVRRDRLIMYIASLVSFVCALLSKELGIILPLLLAITIPASYGYAGKSEQRAAFKKTIPFFAVLAVYLVLRMTVLHFIAAGTQKPPDLTIRLMTTAESFVKLIGLMFWPLEIYIEKNIPFAKGLTQPITLVSIAALAGVWSFTAIIRKRSRMCSFGLTWFFVALIPMANIMPINATIADHWLYLPCMGFFLALIGGLSDALDAAAIPAKRFVRRGSIVLYIVVIGACAFLTVRQNEVWADPIRFYQQAIRFNPKSFRPHNEIGIIYLDKDKLDEAIAEFKKSIELNPYFDQAYDNLGIAYDLKGSYPEAIQAHQKAIELNPNNAKVYNNLGNAYNKAGRFAEAIDAYKIALGMNPGYKAVYNNIGVIYFKQGNLAEAKRYWQKALEIDPNFEMARRNLQVLEQRLQK